MAEFIIGGAVPLDSAAYEERAFESECFRQLAAGPWVLLLGPRQHGKTSALVRLHRRLVEQGLRVVLLDVQRYAGPSSHYAAFARWVSLDVAVGLEAHFLEPHADLLTDLEGWFSACLSETEGDLASS